jgi:MiaB-like tRNA modifying enzyme
MESSPKRVFFKTFGCRTNLFDTQVMIARLGMHHRVWREAEADTVVVNSCTVTNAADSGVRNYISRLRRNHPQIEILFTGCAALTQGEQLYRQGRVDGLFSHAQKERVAHFVTTPSGAIEHQSDHLDETLLERFEGKQRAFVKIQEGCDFSCSYCIIPTVRGRARSYSTDRVATQIEQLVGQGFGEFVLTGTNTGSFGRDRGESLSWLLDRLFQIPGIKRLRLGSLEPSQIDAALMERLTHPVMARHLHIALQHTSNTMLKKMNRINRFESDRALLEQLAAEGFALGTDYIVGFPGESETLFSEALENLERLPLTHIHPFTYSPRDNTPAAALKQDVQGPIAARRRQQVVDRVALKHRHFYQSRSISPLWVLVEQSDRGVSTGLDQYFTRVALDGVFEPGSWVMVRDFSVDETGRVTGRPDAL